MESAISDTRAEQICTYLYLMTPKGAASRLSPMEFDGALYLEGLDTLGGVGIPAEMTTFDFWRKPLAFHRNEVAIENCHVLSEPEDDHLVTIGKIIVGRSTHNAFRGAKHRSHWMGRVSSMSVTESGEYTTDGHAYYSRIGGTWVPSHLVGDADAMLRARGDKESQALFETKAAAAQSIVWLNWCVTIGFAGRPGLTFTTTPEGTRAAFALRDIPNGASRRQSLRNWVRQHARRSSADPNVTFPVKEHLRGAESFTWNGLRVRISPPVITRDVWMRLRDQHEGPCILPPVGALS